MVVVISIESDDLGVEGAGRYSVQLVERRIQATWRSFYRFPATQIAEQGAPHT